MGTWDDTYAFEGCFTKIVDTIEENQGIVSGVAIGVVAVMFLNMLFSFAIAPWSTRQSCSPALPAPFLPLYLFRQSTNIIFTERCQECDLITCVIIVQRKYIDCF